MTNEQEQQLFSRLNQACESELNKSGAFEDSDDTYNAVFYAGVARGLVMAQGMLVEARKKPATDATATDSEQDY